MNFIETYGVPEAAIGVIDVFVSPEEKLLIEALESREFTVETARDALEKHTGRAWDLASVENLVVKAYRKAVLELVDEDAQTYRIGAFYSQLDTFAVSQTNDFLYLPPEVRKALDEWCFSLYLGSLSKEEQPTADKVLSLEETLELIEATEHGIWLEPCDCRILAGKCDKPVEVCLSFTEGINTRRHRGLSKAVSKAEAREVVRAAHDAGLMHTANASGICNCCSDCCYLFRAQKARGSLRAWPQATTVASIDHDVCSRCGACLKRCPFGAIRRERDRIVCDGSICRGCSVCVSKCPTSAISMIAQKASRVAPR